jgi:hypothetical protein
MLQAFQETRQMPAVQDIATEKLAEFLKTVLESKGNNRGKPLMAARILADLSNLLKAEALIIPCAKSAQLVSNLAEEIGEYTGAVCHRRADRFLLSLERDAGIITPERVERNSLERLDHDFI